MGDLVDRESKGVWQLNILRQIKKKCSVARRIAAMKRTAVQTIICDNKKCHGSMVKNYIIHIDMRIQQEQAKANWLNGLHWRQ